MTWRPVHFRAAAQLDGLPVSLDVDALASDEAPLAEVVAARMDGRDVLRLLSVLERARLAYEAARMGPEGARVPVAGVALQPGG